MTYAVVKKYAGLIAEFDESSDYEKQEKTGLVGFLSRDDITDEGLAKLVEVLKTDMGREDGRPLNDYIQDPVFHWVFYVEAFERKGTIKSGLSREEIVERVKTLRKRLVEARARQTQSEA